MIIDFDICVERRKTKLCFVTTIYVLNWDTAVTLDAVLWSGSVEGRMRMDDIELNWIELEIEFEFNWMNIIDPHLYFRVSFLGLWAFQVEWWLSHFLTQLSSNPVVFCPPSRSAGNTFLRSFVICFSSKLMLLCCPLSLLHPECSLSLDR